MYTTCVSVFGKLLTDKVIIVMFTYLFYTTGQLVGLILDANPQAALEKDNLGHYPLHLAAKNTGAQTAKVVIKI